MFQQEETITPKLQTSWYQATWETTWTIIIALWEYRLGFVRDATLTSMAIMMIYFLWTIIKKQTSSGSIVATATTNTSQHTPTTYNNQMSIHVWLNELNEFIEANKINKEEEKQATILNHLDKSSKNIIKKLIEDKRIRNYEELETYLKSFFGNYSTSTSDNLFQFATRRQQVNESLAQYYQCMQELAIKAYPKTPKEIVDEFTNEYFIKGLNNRALREQMVLTKADKKSDVLGNAIEIQSKLACLNETNGAIENFIQHMETNQQWNNNSHNNQTYTSDFTNSSTQQQSRNNNQNQNYCNYTQPNNFQQQNNTNSNRMNYHSNKSAQNNYSRNANQFNTQQQSINQSNNIIQCYNCNQTGHYARDCNVPRRVVRPPNSNNTTSFNANNTQQSSSARSNQACTAQTQQNH